MLKRKSVLREDASVGRSALLGRGCVVVQLNSTNCSDAVDGELLSLQA